MDNNFCLTCGKLTTDKYCSRKCERKYVFTERRTQLLETYRRLCIEPRKCALNEILGYSCGMLCSVEEETSDRETKISKFCGTKHEELYSSLKKKSLRDLQLEYLERRFTQIRFASENRLKKMESQIAELKKTVDSEDETESDEDLKPNLECDYGPKCSTCYPSD